jgi:hypothetical protein
MGYTDQRRSVVKQNPLARGVYGGGSSMPVERPICNRLVVGSIPTRRPNFSALLTALTASRAYLGLAPKAGLVPTVILMPLLEESKTQNDLPQLQNRMPQIR